MSVSATNTVATVAALPELDIEGCAAFTSAGAPALLPLRPGNNYASELIMFGGQGTNPLGERE